MKEIIIDGVTYICTPKEEQSVKKVDHEYVDLGLPSGRLWAICNIGAEKPTDCGDYFAWGAVEPYNLDNFNMDNYDNTEADKLTDIDDAHDAAKVLWGDEWRIPNLTDFDELIEHCTYDSEVIDGIMCGVFTSKANNQKIVMPAAGCFGVCSLSSRGRRGYYWSRSFDTSSYAGMLYFNSSERDPYAGYRKHGYSVRPVRC